MDAIFGLLLSTPAGALLGGFAATAVPLPLLWTTVLVWVVIAGLLATISGLLTGRDGKLPIFRGAAVRPRSAALRLYASCMP
jgi:hypothetical protein